MSAVKTTDVEGETLLVDGLTDEESAALAEGAADDKLVTDAADDEIEAVTAGTATDGTGKTGEADTGAAVDKIEAEALAEGVKDDAAVDAAAADTTKTAGTDAAAKVAADATAAAAEVVEQPNALRQAVPNWQAPEGAEERLKEIATAREALGERTDQGEITYKEMVVELHKLDTEERKLVRAVERAEEAAEFHTANWTQNTVPSFMDRNEHYKSNDTLYAMLDAEVTRRQNEVLAKGGDQFDPKILIEADKAIKAALAGMGVKSPGAAETQKVETEKVTEKAGADGKLKLAAKPVIPPTLANVPAADITGTDSKWAGLDRLASANPEAFEDAYARLPETEREAYLARH